MKHRNGEWRRKRRSRDERECLVQEYLRSDLTQKEFAQRHAISVGTLWRWLREQESLQEASIGSSPGWMEIPVRTTEFGSGQSFAYAIELGNGCKLWIGRRFDEESVGKLLGLMGGRTCSR